MDDRLMLGPLEDVAHDPYITDVAVTCDGRVWVDFIRMRRSAPRRPCATTPCSCARSLADGWTMPVRSPMPRPPAAYACMR